LQQRHCIITLAALFVYNSDTMSTEEYPKTIKAFEAKLFRKKLLEETWIKKGLTNAKFLMYEDGSFGLVAYFPGTKDCVLCARIFSEIIHAKIHHASDHNVLFKVTDTSSHDELTRVFRFKFDDPKEAIRFEETYNTLVTISPDVDKDAVDSLEETGESTQAFPTEPYKPDDDNKYPY
jgi:hypothetical protein